MKKKKSKFDKYFLWLLLVLVVLILVIVIVWNYEILKATSTSWLTGKSIETGYANISWAGITGISVSGTMNFGSGYFNSSCNSTAATLNSNVSYGVLSEGSWGNDILTLSNGSVKSINAFPYCWINTTVVFNSGGPENFSIINNGSSNTNVSAIASLHGEDWLCGGVGVACALTNNAGVQVYSKNNEGSSCTGLTTDFEDLTTFATNNTVGLCDSLDYVDTSDSINVYLNITVPKDTVSGSKMLNITFTAVAV